MVLCEECIKENKTSCSHAVLVEGKSRIAQTIALYYSKDRDKALRELYGDKTTALKAILDFVYVDSCTVV